MTGGGDGVDPLKGEHKYGSGVEPPHHLSQDIDGTGARDGLNPHKVQHKYGSGAGSGSRVDPPN